MRRGPFAKVARRSRTRLASLIALIVVVATGVVIASMATGDVSVRDQLAGWVNPRGDCASVENDSPPASTIHNVPVGFTNAAVEHALVVCNMLSQNTVYFRFSNGTGMRQALRGYPRVLRDRPCLLTSALFTTDGLDTGMSKKFCHRLDGTLVG